MKMKSQRDKGRARYRAEGGKVAGGGLLEQLADDASYARQNVSDVMRIESNKRADQFHDSGLRAPGRSAEKNYKWSKSRGYKSTIVDD